MKKTRTPAKSENSDLPAELGQTARGEQDLPAFVPSSVTSKTFRGHPCRCQGTLRIPLHLSRATMPVQIAPKEVTQLTTCLTSLMRHAAASDGLASAARFHCWTELRKVFLIALSQDAVIRLSLSSPFHRGAAALCLTAVLSISSLILLL